MACCTDRFSTVLSQCVLFMLDRSLKTSVRIPEDTDCWLSYPGRYALRVKINLPRPASMQIRDMGIILKYMLAMTTSIHRQLPFCCRPLLLQVVQTTKSRSFVKLTCFDCWFQSKPLLNTWSYYTSNPHTNFERPQAHCYCEDRSNIQNKAWTALGEKKVNSVKPTNQTNKQTPEMLTLQIFAPLSHQCKWGYIRWHSSALETHFCLLNPPSSAHQPLFRLPAGDVLQVIGEVNMPLYLCHWKPRGSE